MQFHLRLIGVGLGELGRGLVFPCIPDSLVVGVDTLLCWDGWYFGELKVVVGE